MSWLVGDFEIEPYGTQEKRTLSVDASQTGDCILIFDPAKGEVGGEIMRIPREQAERLRELLGLGLYYLDG